MRCARTFYFSFCPLEKYYLIYTLQFNAEFDSYSTYLRRIYLMLGIFSVLFITNFRITEYYMLHLSTFKNTELTKMNVQYWSGRFTNII